MVPFFLQQDRQWRMGVEWMIIHKKWQSKITVWKASKYRVFPGPYFPVFGLNTEKFGTEKTPYLDTFRAVDLFSKCEQIRSCLQIFPNVIHKSLSFFVRKIETCSHCKYRKSFLSFLVNGLCSNEHILEIDWMKSSSSRL